MSIRIRRLYYLRYDLIYCLTNKIWRAYMKKIYCLLITVCACITSSAYSEEAAMAQTPPTPVEELRETFHEIVLNGETVEYKASTGNLVIKDESREPAANIFFVAYTKEGSESPRPVTFCFNGGPGASSVWLHLGFAGPKRLDVVSQEEITGPPYDLVDNVYSLLDVTDIVFIDPVSTGYSHSIPRESEKDFHGIHSDIASVGEFIRLYTTRYGRWNTPKYLMGESYGAVRAAGVAEHLYDKAHMSFDGLILVSPALDFQTVFGGNKNDMPHLFWLPTYAATALYHGKYSGEKKLLEEVLEEAETFARTDYFSALMAGDTIKKQERESVIERYSKYTGLSLKDIERNNLRVKNYRFTKLMLFDEGLVLGRFDTRISGPILDYAENHMGYDPGYESIVDVFTAGANYYLRKDLEYSSDEEYKVISNVFPWDFEYNQSGSPFNIGFPNLSQALDVTMTKNPRMKLFVAMGYYDLATPYYGVEHTLSHLNIPEAQRGNIEKQYYHAGHMMFLHKPSLEKLHKDVSAFITKK
jgi:carboxypeptidase C (cathepsin A)